MNTLHLSAITASSLRPSASLAENCLDAARHWSTEPGVAPMHKGKPLWSELLRFGLQGAALGVVTGLSIALFNEVAALLV